MKVLCLTTIVAILGALQLEAQSDITNSNKLSSAVALLSANRPKDAQAMLSSVPPGDSDYPAAQCYKALSLYQAKNYPQFLKQMETEVVSNAEVDPKLKEELAFNQIDALFAYRRFEQLLPRIGSFQKDHAGDERQSAVSEYQTAALYERGMKKAFEAGNLKDTNQVSERYGEAQANLSDFLRLIKASSRTNYTYLSNRVVREEVWLARMALGEGEVAFSEIPTIDVTAQERFCFLRVRMYAEQLRRDDTDGDIALMTDFLKKYPDSDDRKRVEMDLAEFSFRKGEQQLQQATTDVQVGNKVAAANDRVAADANFEQMRALQAQFSTNRAVGIEDSDVLDSREDMLYSYFLEKNYATVLNLTSAMISDSKAGDLNWIVGKLYEGIALASLPAPKTTDAIADLDAIVALGFNNKPDHNHYVLSAVKWRISIAQKAGDIQKAVQLVLSVQSSACTKNIKTVFLKKYGPIAGLQGGN